MAHQKCSRPTRPRYDNKYDNTTTSMSKWWRNIDAQGFLVNAEEFWAICCDEFFVWKIDSRLTCRCISSCNWIRFVCLSSSLFSQSFNRSFILSNVASEIKFPIVGFGGKTLDGVDIGNPVRILRTFACFSINSFSCLLSLSFASSWPFQTCNPSYQVSSQSFVSILSWTCSLLVYNVYSSNLFFQ